jgi:hypothetical protein
MRRFDGVKSYVRRLSVTVAVFLLVLTIGVVYAANDISVTALQAGYIRAGENGVGGTNWVKRVNFDARWWQTKHDGNAASPITKYFTKQGPLSSSTIGSLGKKALRGGVYGVATQLALEQLIDGAGWAFNELQNQVQVPGTPQEELGQTVYCVWDGADPERYCANVTGQLAGAVETYVMGPTHRGPCAANGPAPSNGTWYACTRISDNLYQNVARDQPQTRPVTGWPSEWHNVNPSTEAVPVSDEQLGEKIRENPGLVNTLLTDPRTGTPVSTPEMQQMIDELKEEIRNREGFDPQDPTPTPDLNDDTETPNEGTEWPSFCSWATVVCEFIDWMRSEDEPYEKPEVPWEETPVEQESWSSGIGGGSCPAPISQSVSIGGQSATMQFEFTGICSFGTMLKPLVLAIASVLAVYIVGGWRRSANA